MRRFEEEFVALNNACILDMGGMVAQSVHRGVLALVDRNADVAYQVMRDETDIDECEIRIDAMAASLIALEQPVAGDMRLVVAAIKISTDLERMGDLAVNIAKRGLSLMVNTGAAYAYCDGRSGGSCGIHGAAKPGRLWCGVTRILAHDVLAFG